jgi:two-component system LytT family sensor kinase
VGLANVRKRLALHYAPTDYALAIQQDAMTYAVSLTLQLTPLAAAPATGAANRVPVFPAHA